jgi:ELWxxDGT repeat protein
MGLPGKPGCPAWHQSQVANHGVPLAVLFGLEGSMRNWTFPKAFRAALVLACIASALASLAWLSASRASTSADPAPELVEDIYLGPGSSIPPLFSIAELNGKVYFNARTAVEDEELWVSDGTLSGTELVKDINPTAGSIPGSLTTFNGRVYFAATTPTDGRELWKSDGTLMNTVLVENINPSTADSNPQGLTVFNNELFFQATEANTGAELWKFNGTTVSQVLDINSFGTNGSSPSQFEAVGTLLFFVAYDGSHGYEIWKTDGTPGGTLLVKDINPSTSSTPDPSTDPRELVAFNGQLFFTANDGSGRALWKTNGTDAGTVVVKQFEAGVIPQRLTVSNNVLFLRAGDAQAGLELWKSDGSTAGTTLVTDIYPGIIGSNPNNLTDLNGILYFLATHPDSGRELWRSDGTDAGTYLVKDINPGTGDSSPAEMRRVNQLLVFQANDGTHGIELWRSNGTRDGTTLVADLYAGATGSFPSGFITSGTLLFFSADDGVAGRELWKMDLANTDPQANAGGPYSGVEGSPITLYGSGTDPDNNTLNYVWVADSGLCTFNDPSLAQPTLTCTDNGTYTVTLTVVDWWAATDSASAQVTVSNAPPAIGQVTTGLVRPGSPFTLTADFTDPGTNDTHTASINWGDGTPVQNATINQAAWMLSANHTYANSGQYSVTITLTDDNSGVDVAVLPLDVHFAVLMPLLRK